MDDKEKAKQNVDRKVVVLISITSDIGTALAERFVKEGWKVIGTYRSTKSLGEISRITKHLYYCDLINKDSIYEFIDKFRELNLEWDLFISCAGTQKPIRGFFECDFNQWNDSVHVNAIEQLRVLHGLYPYRNKRKISDVVFFAGGGTNNAVLNYSAYTISKIMLIKMCELIDFENENVNIFIIGPGWTKTKMHYETINTQKERVGKNYERTIEFMKKGKGTSMCNIFNCINSLRLLGKKAVSGRNFSVVNDKWQPEVNKKFLEELKSDYDMYKLRRYKNNF